MRLSLPRSTVGLFVSFPSLEMELHNAGSSSGSSSKLFQTKNHVSDRGNPIISVHFQRMNRYRRRPVKLSFKNLNFTLSNNLQFFSHNVTFEFHLLFLWDCCVVIFVNKGFSNQYPRLDFARGFSPTPSTYECVSRLHHHSSSKNHRDKPIRYAR
jgi:hypothetical protein